MTASFTEDEVDRFVKGITQAISSKYAEANKAADFVSVAAYGECLAIMLEHLAELADDQSMRDEAGKVRQIIEILRTMKASA